MQLDCKRTGIRIFYSLFFGAFHILAVQWTFMALAKGFGPTDGEGMIGGIVGIFTSPLAIILAWFLYKNEIFRKIIKICACIGLVFIGIVALIAIMDYLISYVLT